MSTSHIETVDVPSFWTKGLVRNIDTSTDYYKIQDAIDNASAEDTLHIWAWTYYENIVIDEELTIIGNGTANTTINGSWAASHIISISHKDVTVKNLKLVSGSNSSSTPLVSATQDNTVLDGLEVNGGYEGIMVVSADDVTILNTKVTGATIGLGIDNGVSNIVIHHSTFSYNSKGVDIESGVLEFTDT